MKPIILLLLAVFATEASAQPMAAAAGRALPRAELEVGTVRVRVFNGAMDKILTDHEVKLVAAAKDRQPLVVKTNKEARAFFRGVDPGTKWFALVEKDGQKAQSEVFEIPTSGGIALFLSPTPFAGQRTQTQAAPPPRREVHVTITRQSTGPVADQDVHLLQMSHTGDTTLVTSKTDRQGIAKFGGLSLSPRFSYIAYCNLLGLGDGETRYDRLQSQPFSMPLQTGVALTFEGSAFGERDMLTSFHAKPKPGTVLLGLYDPSGTGQPGTTELVDLRTKKVVQKIETQASVAASADEIIATTTQQATKASDGVPAGKISVSAIRALGPQQSAPIGGTLVSISGAGKGIKSTGPQGTISYDSLSPGTYQLEINVKGKIIEESVTLTGDNSVTVTVVAQWTNISGARFPLSADARAPQIYLARYTSTNGTFYSTPFFHVPNHGSPVGVVVGKQLMFGWQYEVSMDDEYMGFQGNLTMSNPGAFPYQENEDGVLIPFSNGFIGGQIPEELSKQASVIPTKGLLWRDAVPPGQHRIRLVFSHKIVDGGFDFSQPLPWGAMEYGVIVVARPGMKIKVGAETVKLLPPELQSAIGAKATFEDKHFKSLPQVDSKYVAFKMTRVGAPATIDLDFSGLPARPAYQKYARWLVGGLVILFLIWIASVLWKASRNPIQDDKGTLFESLVALEKKRQADKLEEEAYQKQTNAIREKLKVIYETEGNGA